MKKLKRFIALAVVLIMMCMLLCSCSSLDLVKESQGYWTNAKSTDSITLSDGETYIKLEGKNADKIVYDPYHFYPIYVTDKDVPALLSEKYGTILQMSNDRNYIYGYLLDEEVIFSDKKPNRMNIINYLIGTTPEVTTTAKAEVVYDEEIIEEDKNIENDVVYCKEEIYDEISKEINADLKYTHYGYSYFNESDMYYKFYNLSEDETELIDKILKETTPSTDIYFPTTEINLCTLYKLTDDNVFGELKCEIFVTEDGEEYYLANYNEMTCYYDSYKVSDKYIDDLKRITKIAVESQQIEFID